MSLGCPNCGYENPDSSETCAICNTRLRSTGTGNRKAGPEVRQSAIKGLELIRWSALLVIVSSIASIAFAGIAFSILISSFFPPVGTNVTITGMSAQALTLLIYEIIAVGSVLLVTQLVSVYLLYGGFSHLEKVDPKAGTGKTGSILFLVGIAVLTVIFIAVIVNSIPLLNQVSQGTNITASNVFAIPGLSIFEIVAGIVSFIGIIMVVVGLYNVGTIFQDSTIKVGAIFYILFSFIGAILLLVGTSSIIRRIKETSTEPAYPSI